MPRFRKLRMLNSDVFAYEFNPIKNPSMITVGVPGKFEKLSTIKNPNYAKGYKEVAKINLGFFGGASEHNGLIITDGKASGNPTGLNAECWLTKKGIFHVGRLELPQVAKLTSEVMWGCSLSYSVLINGKEAYSGSSKYSHFNTRNPRTLIGQKADGVIMLVVIEGRSKDSKGATGPESAKIMKELGCINAINADGGGSSEMIVDGKIVNEMSDGKERSIGSALIVYEKI